MASKTEFRAALTRLVLEQENPYARVDASNAALMAGVLWLFGGLLGAILLPFANPDVAVGWPGWIVAGLAIVVCFFMARRRLSEQWDPDFTESFAAGLAALAAIALLEWLAGGQHSPYHYLYALPVVYSAAVHSRRRAVISIAATILAVCAPLIYQRGQIGITRDVVAQIAILLALAIAARILTMTIGVQREALHHARRTAERLARQDPLTALGNRRAFDEAISQEVARARRSRTPLSVAICDIDGFKELNDRFGHLQGDTVLQEVAALLQSTARASDECFRWGGDEFAIVLPGTRRAEAERFCRRLRERAGSSGTAPTTLTFGIAELAPHESPTDFIRAADEALFSRKRREPLMPAAGNTTSEPLPEPVGAPSADPQPLARVTERRVPEAAPQFAVASLLLAVSIVYVVVLAAAGVDFGVAVPALAIPLTSSVIALRGWERDRRAAVAASEAEGRFRLQVKRLEGRLRDLHNEVLAGSADDVSSLLLRAALGLLDAERGALLSVDENGKLEVTSCIGLDLDPCEIPELAHLARRALNEDEAAWSNNLDSAPVENAVAIPVYVADDAHGVVICADRPQGFGEDAREVLLAIGNHAGAVLKNNRLQSELRTSYLATVRMLVDAIAVKDAGLGGHSVEVSSFVERVAERLELDADQSERLCFGSMLHDIGKLGISEQILLKPGPLTPHEREIIELHPRIGYNLVRQVPALRGLADAVLHHHERWDGRGYPDGLSGEEIPLDARIIAIVDAFSAMISDRPYRPRISFEEACAELEVCAGAHFDPEMVRVFCEEVRRGPRPDADHPLEVAMDDPTVAAVVASEPAASYVPARGSSQPASQNTSIT